MQVIERRGDEELRVGNYSLTNESEKLKGLPDSGVSVDESPSNAPRRVPQIVSIFDQKGKGFFLDI